MGRTFETIFWVVFYGLLLTWIWKITDNQQEEYLKQLEEKLKEEQSWKLLLEELNEGIVCFSDDEEVVYLNRACEKLNNPNGVQSPYA